MRGWHRGSYLRLLTHAHEPLDAAGLEYDTTGSRVNFPQPVYSPRQVQTCVTLDVPFYRYSLMTSLHAALQRLARSPVPVVAGGTDFYPALAESAPPADVLDVRGLAELDGIEQRPDGRVEIGAATSWMALRQAALPGAFDTLVAAAREVGSVQIQHRATLGGNLCTASPAADGVPPLLTLDACLELVSASGSRRLALQDFLQGPRTTALREGELLTRICIPPVDTRTASGFFKLGSRRYLVISIAMLAVSLRADARGRINQARVAVGACSPVARRLTALEDTLLECALDDEALLRARVDAHDFASLTPIDDIRGSAGYRRDAVREGLQRLIVAVARKAADTSAYPT